MESLLKVMSDLDRSGFVILPDAVPPEQMPELGSAYDRAMSLAASKAVPEWRLGRTTTRLNGLLGRGPEFEQVSTAPVLLACCRHFFAGPFRLSGLLARTVRPRTGPQALHVDLPRNSADGPMLGLVLMVDAFRSDNGSTAFVPGSQTWPEVPGSNAEQQNGAELACGLAGSMIVFNAGIWHGHTANRTTHPRRSVQGYFVRKA